MRVTAEQDRITETYGTDLDKVITIHCYKCGGTGYIPEFAHVLNGECFACDGRGIEERVTVKVLRRRAMARDRREAKRLEAEAEKEAAAAAKLEEARTWLSENAEEVAKADELGITWHREWTMAPTEKMLAAWRARITEAEKRNAAPALEEGRREIVGKIISAKSQLDTYGYNERRVYKMLVETGEGNRVWGTMPKTIADALYGRWQESAEYADDYGNDYWLDGVKGIEVSFTATVTPSRDDEHFGFFKRPAKAVLV